MKIKTTIHTERHGEIYLTEHDLAVILTNAFRGNTPEIKVDDIDWDVSTLGDVSGLWVRWVETEEPKIVEKEL